MFNKRLIGNDMEGIVLQMCIHAFVSSFFFSFFLPLFFY